MNVTLDPRDQKELEALAREVGKSVEAYVVDALHELVDKRTRNGGVSDEAELVRRQKQALRDFHQELDSLPPEGPQDGFSGRDHDEILYGWKK